MPGFFGHPAVRGSAAAGGAPAIRVETLQLALGLYQVAFGAQLVLAPTPFDTAAFGDVYPHVRIWGGATLLSGSALLVAALAPLPPIASVAVHVLSAAIRCAFAAAYLRSGAWAASIFFAAGAVALVAVPPLRGRAAAPVSRDLYALFVGGACLVAGLSWMLVSTPMHQAPFAPSGGAAVLQGAALALAGAVLLAVQLRAAPRGATVGAHVFAAAVLLTLVPPQAAVGHASATAWFAWHALVVAALPWIDHPLRAGEPAMRRVRLPIAMAALTAAPATICIAVVAAQGAMVESADGTRNEQVFRHLIWFVAVVAIPITAAAGFLGARWLARPLRDLTGAVHDLGAGRAPGAVPASGLHEVAQLAAGFEQMRARLTEREQELRRSQEQLQAILEHVPAAVYLKDPQGRYLLASRRALELKGTTAERLVGRTDAEIFPAEVAAAITANDAKVMQDREPHTFDEMIETPHGLRTQLSIKFPLFDESGGIYALGGISTDITERKWAEQLLAQERKVLQLSAEGAPLQAVLDTLLRGIESLGSGMVASILLLDADGAHIRTASAPTLPRAYTEQIEGSPIGPATGSCGTAAYRREPVIVADIATDPLWSDYREIALRHGLRACWSVPIVDARGTVLGTFALYYRYPKSPSAEHLRAIGMVARTAAVILERRKLEDERERLLADLAAAGARYRGLFEGTSEAIILIAADGSYLDANPAASLLTGYSREELQRMKVGDLAPGGGAVLPAWSRIVAEGRWSGESSLVRRNGESVPVDTRVTRVSLESGVVYLSTMRDISDRRALEQLRREFLATVGHELRNPLASIAGSAELMRRSGKLSERSVERIIRQSRQLDRLVSDLLDAEMIEMGQLRVRMVDADLAPLLRACVEEAAATSSSHPVELILDQRELTGVWDPDRVCQVLRNLLSNAMKYSPADAAVRVEVRASADVAEIAVQDHGYGIPAEALPRLFERFYRAPGSKDRAPGLGLGLHVCKHLVEAHGGTLHVASEPGVGTRITFSLPRRAASRRASPAA